MWYCALFSSSIVCHWCFLQKHHDPFAPQKKRIMKNHGQSCVCAPRKWLWTRNNSTSEHWCRKIIWQRPRFFSNKELFYQGKWKTFSFIHPWSTPNAAPVWSDKGLISYDRPLQPWRYRAPINSSAINLLHQTLLPSVCSCLPSIRAPSPACKSWRASSEGSSVGRNGDGWLGTLSGRRAHRLAPLEPSRSAAHFKFPLWYYIWHSIWNPKLL